MEKDNPNEKYLKMITYLKKLSKKNIHIIGISGLEGWAMLDFFLTKGFQNITAHDFIEENDFQRNFIKNHPGISSKETKKILSKLSIYKKRIKFFFKKNYLKEIDKADFIFVPQSWFLYKENRRLFKIKNKIPFLGIINIYFAFAPAKIIGITGSYGKTTTSRLTYYTLKKSNKRTFYGGNDKKAAQSLSEIPKMKKNDFLVLEISHRQLMNYKNLLSNPKSNAQNLTRTPFIAVVLNISRNHLDEVKTFKEYRELKKRILLFQKPKEFSILNYDDLSVRKFATQVKSKTVFFSVKKPLKEGVFFDKKSGYLSIKTKKKIIKIIKKEELSFQAQNHLEDVLAAITVSFLAKVKIKNIKRAIKDFSWPRDCLENLAKIGGINYYNNLASTTPESTEIAIKSLEPSRKKDDGKRLILITGGEDKKSNYKKLSNLIKKNVEYLILFQDTVSNKLIKWFSKEERKSIKKAANLKEAIKITKEKSREGDSILLSPSGAFFQTKYGKRKNLLKLVFTP